MGLFSKKVAEPTPTRPDPLPIISDEDLASASRLMDRWDASMGNTDAIWKCLEAIGARGGYRGGTAYFEAIARGDDGDLLFQRQWRWWNEAARAANGMGQDILVGRIFLFAYLFVMGYASQMDAATTLETGLVKPADQYYTGIAALAVDSLSRLSPELLIHDTATGQVNVEQALKFAEQVSGVAP